MPRQPTAPTDLGYCPVHGETTVRRHNHGTNRRGEVRIAWKCLPCHNARQNAVNRGEPLPDAPTSIGFCNAEGHVGITPTVCRRPHGHPADLHVDADGRMWAARTEIRTV